MKDKLSLLILFGGASSEHEVSCASAESVLNNIDSEKYHINTIGITKEGNWFLTSSPAVISAMVCGYMMKTTKEPLFHWIQTAEEF